MHTVNYEFIIKPEELAKCHHADTLLLGRVWEEDHLLRVAI